MSQTIRQALRKQCQTVGWTRSHGEKRTNSTEAASAKNHFANSSPARPWHAHLYICPSDVCTYVHRSVQSLPGKNAKCGCGAACCARSWQKEVHHVLLKKPRSTAFFAPFLIEYNLHRAITKNIPNSCRHGHRGWIAAQTSKQVAEQCESAHDVNKFRCNFWNGCYVFGT